MVSLSTTHRISFFIHWPRFGPFFLFLFAAVDIFAAFLSSFFVDPIEVGERWMQTQCAHFHSLIRLDSFCSVALPLLCRLLINARLLSSLFICLLCAKSHWLQNHHWALYQCEQVLCVCAQFKRAKRRPFLHDFFSPFSSFFRSVRWVFLELQQKKTKKLSFIRYKLVELSYTIILCRRNHILSSLQRQCWLRSTNIFFFIIIFSCRLALNEYGICARVPFTWIAYALRRFTAIIKNNPNVSFVTTIFHRPNHETF